MILRLYRFTDKIGMVLLKLSAEAGAWLATGANVFVTLTARGTGGILAFIWLILMSIAALILRLFGLIGNFFRFLFNLTGRGARATAHAGSEAMNSGVRNANEAMARRALIEEARDEIDVIIKEDPLRIQNRRLSALVLVLGVFVVGAVLWATDPNRNSQTPLVAVLDPAALLPVSTNQAEDGEVLSAPIPTAIPTATPIPEALRARGSLAYTSREAGQTDIWAVLVGSRNPIRITNDSSDERDPEWNKEGTRLAYASRQYGNWDLHLYDLATNSTVRLTYGSTFEANPTWSPDNLWLAYEYYIGDNLDIYAQLVDGSRAPERITDNPAPDFSPSWAANGREIAFASWREGNQDIFVISLNNREEVNISNTPLINEDYPVWSPDGRYLAYSAFEQGSEKVFLKDTRDLSIPAQVIGFGRTPAWSPDGASLAFVVDSTDGTRSEIVAVTLEGGIPSQIASVFGGSTAPTWSSQSLPPALVNSGGLPLGVDVLYTEQVNRYDTGAPYRLQSLGNVQNDPALLSDQVNDSFDAMRRRVLEQAGVDFLGDLDETFWALDRPIEPGVARRNWHMTGRAFSISRNKILGFPPLMEIVREDIGVNTYWRIYVRVDEASQSGQLGEPLRRMPWDFLSVTQGDVEAYNQGGRLRREMPTGYYMDLTQLAADYGWGRVSAATDWRANNFSINYWLFTKAEGLEWYDAMLEIYPEGQIANFAPSS